MSSLKLSIIVPVFNEKNSILPLLRRVQEQRQKLKPFGLEIIVVDDGSKDGTTQVLRENSDLYNHLECQVPNQGKGAAVRKGLQLATGQYILFQDGDLEYDPESYVDLIQPVLHHNADLVFGSRFKGSHPIRVPYFWNRIGNRIITFFFNLMHNTSFTDVYSCYLLFRRELISPEELRTSGWQQQAEILCRLVDRGKIFYEVGIAYHGRSHEEGKKIRARHLFQVLWTIFRESLHGSEQRLPIANGRTHS